MVTYISSMSNYVDYFVSLVGNSVRLRAKQFHIGSFSVTPNFSLNTKVLSKRKSHTARCVARARNAALSPNVGWYPHPVPMRSTSIRSQRTGGGVFFPSGRMGLPPIGQMVVPPTTMVYKVKTLPSVILRMRAVMNNIS